MNPLRQHFRRPAIYLTLPSNGDGYKPGIIQPTETGEFPVFPMTAIDEITSKTPDALYNGEAMASIIRSCVPNILNPWAITSVDMDAILIAIRTASHGSKLSIESACPKCQEFGSYEANLTAILTTLKAPNYEQTLEHDGLLFKLRPLTFKEINHNSNQQFELQRALISIDAIEKIEERNARSSELLKAITAMTMQVVASTIEYIMTPEATVSDKNFILEYLQNCDNNVYTLIRDHNATLKEASGIKPLDIKCHNCGHKYKHQITLNFSDFFG